MSRIWGFIILVVVTSSALFPDSSAAASLSLESQRQLYKNLARQHSLNKPLDPRTVSRLRSYPLYPYLEGMQLSQQLDNWPKTDIDNFLEKYDQQVPARKLRVETLQATVRQKRWNDYLNYYRPEMATVAFRCYWLEALHQTGKSSQALNATPAIWLNGESFPDACDSPMNRWLNSKQRSDNLILERAVLALNHDNKSLASFLIRKLSRPAQAAGENLLRVNDNPRSITRIKRGNYAKDLHGEVLLYGLGKFLKQDSEKAIRLWETAGFRNYFNKRQLQASRELVGRRVIADYDTNNALQWLLKYDPQGSDAYLLEWRIRLALRLGRWQDVSQWIGLLPAPLAEDTSWQYWQARAWQKTNSTMHQVSAETLMTKLAKQRDYYGFLAADHLKQDYSFNALKLKNSPSKLTAKSAAALSRAKEFYAIGEISAARMEWREAMRDSEGKGLKTIVSIAENWGWHNEIMRQAQKSKLDDHLDLRFPMPFKSDMKRQSSRKSVDMAWVYAIARQESAFMPDAKSPVGALGLLQLMPVTATQVAKKQGYRLNVRQLTQPQTNIDLGTSYLQALLKTFDNNRILATASYNGGPTRIKKLVLAQTKPVEHDIWVETLPYYETRDYVKRVMSYALIYDYQINENNPQRKLFEDNEKLIQLDPQGIVNPP